MDRRTFFTGTAGLMGGALALSACGGDGASGDGGGTDGTGKTISVLIAANSNLPEEQRAWFTEISAEFEKQTKAKVSFDTFASANDELQRIQTSVASGQGPDVYMLGTTFTPLAASTGAFVPLDDEAWKKVGGKDRFDPASLGISGKDEDNLVAVPLRSRPFVLAYNTELFDAAGITEVPKSWDELREVAKTLTKDGVFGLAIAYADTFDPWKFIWAMALQAGTEIVTKDKKAQLDDPAVLAAYQTYFGWLTEDKVVDPASIGWTNSQALAEFASGKAAIMLMTTATSFPTLEGSEVKGKYQYALMPTIPPGATELPSGGKDAASIISGDNVVVADYSEVKDLAFAFLKLLTDKDPQIAYQKTFGDFPTNTEALAAVSAETVAFKPIAEAASKSFGTPFVGSWSQIQVAMTEIATKNLPELAKGPIAADTLTQQLSDAQTAAQKALDAEPS